MLPFIHLSLALGYDLTLPCLRPQTPFIKTGEGILLILFAFIHLFDF
jgi:hypothetical protein